MAKDNNAKIVALLEEALTLAKGGGTTTVTIPAPDDVAELTVEQLSEIAEAVGIDTEGVKPKALRALILSAANVVAGETEDLDKDQANALCEAVGVSPAKKLGATIEALKEYFDAAQDGADGAAAETEEEEEEDEAPAKSKKKAKAAAEEEEEEEEASEEEEEEAPKSKKAAKKGKAADEEEEEEETEEEETEEEEVSPKEQKKRLAAYNEAADKPLKNYAALVKLLTDDDGNVAEWGEPYTRSEEGEEEATAFCCGLELETVKKKGKELGKCAVTGKLFEADDEGNLSEYEA